MLFNAGKYADAKTQFDTATKADPNNAGAFYQLGMTSLNLGQIPDAISALQTFLKLAPNDPKAAQAAIEKWDSDNPPRSTLSQVADHIDHIRKVAGIDHIGIGSDFDGIDGQAPTGLEDVSKFPNLTRALLERGYSADDVRKIYGGNLLRVMRAVEKSASKN